jgi:hypothetical protein
MPTQKRTGIEPKGKYISLDISLYRTCLERFLDLKGLINKFLESLALIGNASGGEPPVNPDVDLGIFDNRKVTTTVLRR